LGLQIEERKGAPRRHVRTSRFSAIKRKKKKKKKKERRWLSLGAKREKGGREPGRESCVLIDTVETRASNLFEKITPRGGKVDF